MRRLFYAGTLAEEITITGGDAHHLARVMRAQIGDEVTVADTDGSFLDSPFMPRRAATSRIAWIVAS